MDAHIINALGNAGSYAAIKYLELHKNLITKSPSDQFNLLNMKDTDESLLNSIVKINVIDMVLEPFVGYYLQQKILTGDGEDVILLTDAIMHSPEKVYDLNSIRSHATRFMPDILKYWEIISTINLTVGGGVKRYRPLARYFLSYTGRDRATPFFAKFIERSLTEDYESITPTNPQKVVSHFVLSANGGFGSGSAYDVSLISGKIIKNEPNLRPTSNIFFYHLLLLSSSTGRYIPQQDLVAGNIIESLASGGAMLVELLYAKYASIRDEKEIDSVGKLIHDFDGKGAIKGYKLPTDQPTSTMLTLHGYKIKNIQNYQQLYDKIGEKLATFLTALTYGYNYTNIDAISKKYNITIGNLPLNYQADILSDNEFTNARATIPNLPMGENIVDLAQKHIFPNTPIEIVQTLLTPAAISSGINLELDLTKAIPPNLIDLSNKYVTITNKIKELKERIRSRKEYLDLLKRRLSKIDKIKEKFETEFKLEITDEETKRYLTNVKNALNNIISKLESAQSNAKSKAYATLPDTLKSIKSELVQNNEAIFNNIQSKLESFETYRSAFISFVEGNENRLNNEDEINRLFNDKRANDLRNAINVIKFTDAVREIITKDFSKIKSLAGTIQGLADEDCKWYKPWSKPCRARLYAREILEVINRAERTLQGILTDKSYIYDNAAKVYDLVKNSIYDLATSVKNDIENTNIKIKQDEQELEKLENQLKTIEDELDKAANNLVNILPRYYMHISDFMLSKEIVNKIILPRLKSGTINSISSIGLDEIIKTVDREVARNIIKSVTNVINEAINSYDVSLDTNLLNSLGMDLTNFITDIFIITSKHNVAFLHDLLKELSLELENSQGILRAVILPNIQRPYFAVVKITWGVPIIFVEEVQEALNAYSEEVTRNIHEIVEEKIGVQTIFKEKERFSKQVKEPRGWAFHGIQMSQVPSFKEFSIKVIEAVKELNQFKQKAS